MLPYFQQQFKICNNRNIISNLHEILDLYLIIFRLRMGIAQNWRSIPSTLTEFLRLFIFRSELKTKIKQ